jgi:hypothetical protein
MKDGELEKDGGVLFLTDAEILDMIECPRKLPPGWKEKVLRLRQQKDSQHMRSRLKVKDSKGRSYIIFLRQSMQVPDKYSAGLSWIEDGSGESTNLLRCNGKDDHRNPIEMRTGHADWEIRQKEHIHRATYRYQEIGKDAEHFAAATSRYNNLEGALDSLIKLCRCEDPDRHDGLTEDLFDDEAAWKDGAK